MVVSADIYRPAAIKQLETLANDIGVTFFPSDLSQKPVDIAQAAIKEAKLKFIDVVIVDTAGRLHIDEEMMGEIKALHAAINPVETLFVVDAMTGQDAANTAKAFGDALPLTRSEERRVGKECVSTCRSRWSAYHYKNKQL